MYIAAIETTGAQASVALADEKGVIRTECLNDKMNHLQNLMPMMETLFRETGADKKELDHIAVSEGPGSFTGIRIGMAAAKGLAYALGLDIICVPTLKSFAYHKEAKMPGVLCCPIFDARRNQVYAGAYYWDASGKLQEAIPDGAYDTAEFFRAAACIMDGTETENETGPGDRAADGMETGLGDRAADGRETGNGQGPVFTKCVVYGDGISQYQSIVEEFLQGRNAVIAEENDRFQSAGYTAMMALDKAEAGEFTALSAAEPVYIRKAEAQRKLEEAIAAREAAQAGAEAAEGDGLPGDGGNGAGAGQGNPGAGAAQTALPPIRKEDISIRRAVLQDDEALEALDKLCFTIPWSKSAFAGQLENPERNVYLVAEAPGRGIVGYAGVICVLDEGEITNIAVHPEGRGQGIGTLLLDLLLEQAVAKGVLTVTLEVRESNREAIGMYKRAGFRVLGQRKKYYSDNGENALLMSRSSKNPES